MLILIRHAEAEGEGDAPLSAFGQQQAKLLASRLVGIPITKVYVSPYRRAKETLKACHSLQDTETVEHDGLKEIYRLIIGGPAKEGTRPHRVEEDSQRANGMYESLREEGGVVAVFTHGNLIRYFIAKALHVDPAQMWDHLQISCTSISIIQDDEMVKLINSIDHLSEEELKRFYGETEQTHYLP